MPAGAFYGQEATMPAATQPVRCIFWVKTGAFYDQEGAFYGQEASEWNQECSIGLEYSVPLVEWCF